MSLSKNKVVTLTLICIALLGIILGIVSLFRNSSIGNGRGISDSTGNILFSNRNFSTEKCILIISSYNQSYPATEAEIKGIVDVLGAKGYSFEVNYLDSNAYPSDENEQLFYEMIKYKISHHTKFDSVILLDDAALEFAQKHYEEFFRFIPVIFMGVSNENNAFNFCKNYNVTGILQNDTIYDTLLSAVNLLPDAENIVVLTDGTATGLAYSSLALAQQRNFPNKKISVINATEYTSENLVIRLRSLDIDTIFLYLALHIDGNHHIFTSNEAHNFILSNVYKTPVFQLNYGEISGGILGGKVYDFYEAGRESALLAHKAMGGNFNLMSEPLRSDTGGRFVYDYSVLRKFNLNEKNVPPETIFLNKESNFFQTYSIVIVPFLVISTSLVVLLIILFVSYSTAARAQILVTLRNKAIDRKNRMLKASEEKLRALSERDYLTGIPNRFMASEKLKEYIAEGEPFTICQIDIDNFKNYNDYYTHDCGDFVLIKFAERLSTIASRMNCFVARFGGDEFLILSKGQKLFEKSETIEYMRQLLNSPCIYEGISLNLSSSCGVAIYEPGVEAEKLLSNADLAMYDAKTRGKGNVSFYNEEMRNNINQKNKILQLLENAIEENSFTIRFQPQIDSVKGSVHGYEALVRMERENVSPGIFIPIAEECGLIPKIGRIVTEKVIQQMAEWKKSGMELKKVAINYSSGQLVDSDYVSFLAETLSKYNIPSKLVEIEITESLFMGNTNLSKIFFEDLSKIGVELVLDDFGTGYSSLSYLTYLPIRKVKIDKTLVDNYLVEGKEKFILNISHLVHDLGMDLTVEGIEQKWQLDMLRKLHCDYIQGYYFSKPITGTEVLSFKVTN